MRKNHGDILIELIQQGKFIKVSAVDAITGLEVSIVGDAKQSQQALEQAAVRKLQYVRRKRRATRQAEAAIKPKRHYRSTSGWDM